MSDDVFVSVEAVGREFVTVDRVAPVLRDVTFTVGRGELLAIRARSGAGKTTLLNLVGGLDRPSTGRVVVGGADVTAMPEAELLAYRRGVVGVVFQSFALLPILSAAENVGLPLRLAGTPAAQREERVRMLLELVGVGKHANQRPDELSGGQQQRVAVARALANDPPLLLADEPTGQLDPETGLSIMRLIRATVDARHTTVLVATHDTAMLDLADRVVTLQDGRIQPFAADPTAEDPSHRARTRRVG
jgi:putative ABC transport system ATP-binding protein